MRIRPLTGMLYEGQHLDPSSTYDVEEGFARFVVADGRAEMAPAAAPTPAAVVETREPAVVTREPKVRRRP